MAVERAEQISLPEDAPKSVAPVVQREQQPRRLFDVDEYYRMAEVGILKPDERVELIEGEIRVMSPIGGRHAWNVDRLIPVFVKAFGDVAWLRVQNPVRLQHRVEPEPDISVSRLDARRARRYQSSHPGPDDVLLVLEIAETSLDYDLGEKADLYARYGIPELWVLDLAGDRLIIHREPTAEGYASVMELPRGESISPLAFPDVAFTADEVLGAPLPEGTSTDDLDDEAAGGQ